MDTRSFLTGLSIGVAFVVGCLVSRVVPEQSVPVARAAPSPGVAQRWDYSCFKASSDITDYAKKLGAEGWEMVAGAGAGWGQGMLAESKYVFCFKRPL